MKVRKKAVVVDAAVWTGNSAQNWPETHKAEFSKWELVPRDGSSAPGLAITTREGTMTAAPGDYVIRGVEGEFYPIAKGIFEKTYDIIEPDPPGIP